MTAVLVAATQTAAAEITLIHAGQLLTVAGERPASEQTIVVDGDRIVDVVDGFAEASTYGEDTRVIDLRDHFVLPGLMDMHVHLQGELGPNNEKETLKMSSQLMQMRSIHFAMKTLMAGFTTVRDVGSSAQEMYAMRDAIDKRVDRRPTHYRCRWRWYHGRARRHQRREARADGISGPTTVSAMAPTIAGARRAMRSSTART